VGVDQRVRQREKQLAKIAAVGIIIKLFFRVSVATQKNNDEFVLAVEAFERRKANTKKQ